MSKPNPFEHDPVRINNTTKSLSPNEKAKIISNISNAQKRVRAIATRRPAFNKATIEQVASLKVTPGISHVFEEAIREKDTELIKLLITTYPKLIDMFIETYPELETARGSAGGKRTKRRKTHRKYKRTHKRRQ
jgi:hypothetical protein